MMRRWLVILLGSLLVQATAGCATDPTQGYTTASLYPARIRTVSVPIFENRTYDREVEFELTDAVVKEIEARTPYRVTSRGDADTILLGTVRSVEREHLSKSRLSGLSEEVLYTVTIDFEWRDLRTDEAIVVRRSFTTSRPFHPSTPFGESFELGRSATVQQLARDIVTELQADW